MWQAVAERWADFWQTYRKPLLWMIYTTPVYMAFGPEIECSRCPMPPMTTLEYIVFIAQMLQSIIMPTWFYLIYIGKKYREEGHWD